MRLASGARLGPYEIVEPLGAGGMGEVYKARDTRHARFVALKVLGTDFQHDPSGRQRFEREAQAIAALTHPHICVLHDVSAHEGSEYLVMEYLEGETLAARLRAKPNGLPLKEVLVIAGEIASALDAAHRRGIVHRDLKPANVMLTKGVVKLLDFGLAKLRQPAIAGAADDAATRAVLTGPMTVLGTLHYMSPEQLEGREADARSDIFAFGSVLYEMLTGRRAFDGSSTASVVAAILSHEPLAPGDSQTLAPPLLNDLLRACLAKGPDQRWQSAGDLERALTWAARDSDLPLAAVSRLWSTRRLLQAITAGLLLIAAGGFVGRWIGRTDDVPPAFTLSVVPPEGASLHSRTTESVEMALSRDGRALAFIAASADGRRHLYVRPLDSLESRLIASTEGADFPFWSPDGSMIGFFAKGKLKKVGRDGGEPQAICDVGRVGGGATWNQDGVIVFSPFFEGALSRVSSSGGTPTPLTTLDVAKGETHHFHPRFLPDGKHFLFQMYARVDSGEYVGQLDSPERTRVIEQSGLSAGVMGQVADYAPGNLVFVRGTTLFAQAFDPDRRELRGEPVRIAEGVGRAPGGFAAFTAASAANLVAYRRADPQKTTRLTWFDRSGRAIGWAGSAAPYENVALSPDGKRVAVQRWDTPERRSIWVIDSERGTETRFTTNPDDMTPLWSPDGSRIVYASARDTPPNLFVRSLSDDEHREDRLFTSRFVEMPTSWSADGRVIVYAEFVADTGYDILRFDVETGTRSPLLQTPADEENASLSADGRWIAYSSDETGRREVYVKPIDGRGRAMRISANGGEYPVWRRDGREIFYVEGRSTLMSVAVAAGGEATIGRPARLFQARFGPSDTRAYDVSADGQRLLVSVVVDEVTPSPIHVVVNGPARR